MTDFIQIFMKTSGKEIPRTEKDIRENLAQGERSKKEGLSLKSEYEEKLKNAETEAEEILSQARKRALKNERAILDQAKEEAAGIIANANVQIELEKKKAMDDLKASEFIDWKGSEIILRYENLLKP